MDRRLLWFLGAGLLVTAVIAGVVSGFASDQPDGLERVSIDQGFADEAEENPASGSPLAGYDVEGIDDDRVSTGLAGVLGVLVTLLVATGLLWVIRRYGRSRAAGG